MDTTNQTIYQKNGYKNRRDYLENLAEEHGLSKSIVFAVADMLGPNEDFDGLISELEMAEDFDF